MDPQAALTLGQNALFLILMVSAPVLATVLGVGLLVSLFQAITQIHEATLSFVPKLIAAIAVFAIAGPWMMTTLVDFLRTTILSIPDYAV
ncbi:MAG TPA: flagellar biosynthetic protein FliQ [Hydrogenophaga sp.]|jgi:flagellar biosynthetic protein FliQ|uniref:flagellar biosynthesis protein FliQ n=1 Tax=Hydrogenophaga sp. TaxID=1904254 RepID=UPI0008AC222D|nr:flagellar biosynthesis protein FliQ [Hydrogenophaga sp.]MBU4180323.1 flagellar biosynthesis protein FliQ [Gammaproteobacteria bacterium]MBW8469019.1 flagellar biosynthesis protein FliQ [Thiobacillus sp.]OGA75104.1 MAG: flagellar biosynthetic protein FliQ [Burkholderiales bacterium GWE1_65_30]OGA90856.1 MAG: flagellar biosynthetic protein FliQ [Burkholderiales bacterium GWF1_66_17]OGB27108.1 MAG: flagellar biosynthetic protein FliQ [Burkholderiales bacterium RIFCSPHIGHO2_02_FULL_66_10]OGB36